jgi:hypothetical protein
VHSEDGELRRTFKIPEGGGVGFGGAEFFEALTVIR